VSQLLIQHYLNELQTLRRVSGSAREGVVKPEGRPRSFETRALRAPQHGDLCTDR